jgi:hypothetical protein
MVHEVAHGKEMSTQNFPQGRQEINMFFLVDESSLNKKRREIKKIMTHLAFTTLLRV